MIEESTCSLYILCIDVLLLTITMYAHINSSILYVPVRGRCNRSLILKQMLCWCNNINTARHSRELLYSDVYMVTMVSKCVGRPTPKGYSITLPAFSHVIKRGAGACCCHWTNKIGLVWMIELGSDEKVSFDSAFPTL